MLERPYEEQEGEYDVHKRPERDESRYNRVAVRFEERERFQKVPASAGGDGVRAGTSRHERARLPGFEPAQAQCLYFLGTQKVSFG
mgnify:CR=1 FL=1